MKTKADILKDIKGSGFPDVEVAINIDDFFDNENCSESCIGVNVYPNQPSPEKFHEVFKDLIARNKANRIFVRISDIDDPEEWFYSDTVYVIGNLTFEEIKNSTEILSPTFIYEDFFYGKPANIMNVENGEKTYSLWWD